jgi:hypothetical protein
MAVDVEDAAVVPGLGQRAYGGTPPSDQWFVARAQPVQRGHDGARPGRTPRSLAAWARGEGASWNGGRPWAGCGPGQTFLPVTSLKIIFSKILYTSAPNVEYES